MLQWTENYRWELSRKTSPLSLILVLIKSYVLSSSSARIQFWHESKNLNKATVCVLAIICHNDAT